MPEYWLEKVCCGKKKSPDTVAIPVGADYTKGARLIMSKSALTLVHVEEEYGYRQWQWEARMSPDDLIRWWQGLESVMPYFYSPKVLRGKVQQVKYLNRKGWYCHLHCDDDSVLISPTGERYYHAGYSREG